MTGISAGSRRSFREPLRWVSVAVLAYAVLRWPELVFVPFSGALLAVFIDALARPILERVPIPRALVVGMIALIAVGSVAALVVFVAPSLTAQFHALAEELPRGVERAQSWLESRFGTDPSSAVFSGEGSGWARRGLAAVSTGVDALAQLLVVVLIGILVAAAPDPYLSGLLKLVRPARRARVRQLLAWTGRALRRWLVGRAALMAIVFVVSAVGLKALGVPLALPLAFVAGALSFVPYLGPALAFILAVMMGFSQSPALAAKVALLYLAIQLVESYVLEPLIEAKAAKLPPAAILFAQLVSVAWAGAPGTVIATPLLLVIVILVQALYVEDVLGDQVSIPGRKAPGARS